MNMLREGCCEVLQREWKAYAGCLACCCIIYFFLWPKMYLAGHDYAAHVIQDPDHAVRGVHRFFDSQARASYELAQRYYEDQRPLVLKSARNFHLKNYFAELEKEVTGMDITFYDLIRARLALMGMWHEKKGWDDYRVEKDKCTMYSWLKLNNFPHVPLHFEPDTGKPWRSEEKFIEDMRSGSAYTGTKNWPLWIKACHLTQGSAESTRPIKNAEWISENIDALDVWAKAKWDFQANDWEREWRDEGNALTDGLPKGFLLQESAQLTFDPNIEKKRIFELKIEVYWGHAYIAGIADVGAGSLVMRWSDGRKDIELYDDVAATFWHHGHLMKKSDWYQWIMEEGHVDCAFELAERAASVMAVDEVRIDVFITKGDPEGCKINENSLSSGMIYGPQWGFMAKLWAEPYIRKEYKTFSLDEKRVYEQTVDDVPGLRERLEKAGK